MSRKAASAIVANLFICGLPLLAAVLFNLHSDLYYRSVQEDEVLEWSTFWAFVSASVAYGAAARSQRVRIGDLPWFLSGVALFCAFVAMEEISWGQRLFGYRPPSYFLENNFQQELNIHNIGGDRLRQWSYMGIVIGYGIAMPVLWLAAPLRQLGERIGLVAPSPATIPAFAATATVYIAYPWTFSGEWSELMLGLAMLFTAMAHIDPRVRARSIASACVATWALGAGTAQAWFQLAGSTADQLEGARVELRALRSDLAKARSYKECGIHKRVYSYVEKYEQQHLLDGEFAELVAAGLPAERARFFLDPWNSPYWFKHVCAKDASRRAILVYSFGPNRHRDSTRWEVIEDDLAGWVSRPEPVEEP
jgi:hypothetical protein